MAYRGYNGHNGHNGHDGGGYGGEYNGGYGSQGGQYGGGQHGGYNDMTHKDPYGGGYGAEYGDYGPQDNGYHDGYGMYSPQLDGGPGPEVNGYDDGYGQGMHRSLSDGDRRPSAAQGPGQSAPNRQKSGGHRRQQDRILQSPVSPQEMPQDNPFPSFPLPDKHKKGGEHRGNHSHGHGHSHGNQQGNRAPPNNRQGPPPNRQASYDRPSPNHTDGYRGPPPQRQYSNDAPRQQPERSGWDNEFGFDQDHRSQTMPTNNYGGAQSFDLPRRPAPGGHRRSDEGPGHRKQFSYEDVISPRSINNDMRPPPRSDSFSAGARPNPPRMSPAHNQGSGGYAPHPFSSPEEELDMPDFDNAPVRSPPSELHMSNAGMLNDSRGRAPLRPPVHDFEPRSHSQPNFRDGPRGPPGGPPGGFASPAPGNYGSPPGSGYGAPPRQQAPALEPGYGRGGPGPRQGPPPGQFQPRPRGGGGPAPSPGPGGRGRPPPGGPIGLPGPGGPAGGRGGRGGRGGFGGPGGPGGPGGRGGPPNNRPMNPDALPEHPAPVRPGLMQNQGMGPSPVPQPYPQQGPPPQRAQTMPQQAMSAPRSEPTPVTMDELARLRQMVNSNPNDQSTQLSLAEKLVEASSTLVPSKQYADHKTRDKARRKFLDEAHRLLKRLIGYGSADAMFVMADCHGRGLFTPGPDYKEAFNMYQQAAKLNHAQAAYRLAVCCELGQDEGGGTRRDPIKAIQWYRRAATLGDTPAMYKIGVILLKGLLGQGRNPREAMQWLQKAAERADEDNPHAVHELALLYQAGYPGDGIPRDDRAAADLFQQAAHLGYKFAQYQLGAAYEYGSMGFPIDPRQSIAWYSKAAAQEEHQSELALSGWYLTGSDGVIQQSDTEAYLWARKAAQAGLSKAEYAMGYFNEVGIGAPADLEAAKRWYWRAASQNYPKARERLEDLRKGGRQMQKSQVTRNEVKRDGECVLM